MPTCLKTLSQTDGLDLCILCCMNSIKGQEKPSLNECATLRINCGGCIRLSTGSAMHNKLVLDKLRRHVLDPEFLCLHFTRRKI